VDNHFRDEKIKELTEQLAMVREENKTLKSRVSDLEAELYEKDTPYTGPICIG
jgi:BMFP domain-containing protein YqiC